MKLEDGCYSLKLECALRELGFVDIGWKCVAHAGIFFIQPFGLPDKPDGDLLGFCITRPSTKFVSKKVVKLTPTAKRALDFATGVIRKN
tara:strand:- start:2870 stop:3136 length:267 start_codon:yes stop_codon:yes gene_type:complete